MFSSRKSKWMILLFAAILGASLVLNVLLLARSRSADPAETRASVDRITVPDISLAAPVSQQEPLHEPRHEQRKEDSKLQPKAALISELDNVPALGARPTTPAVSAKAPPRPPVNTPDRTALQLAVLGDLQTTKARAPQLLDEAMVREEASLPAQPSDDDITQALARVAGTVSTQLLPALLDAQLPPAPYTATPKHLKHPISAPTAHEGCTRVVVGITTLPSRVAHLSQIIASLGTQSYPIHAIHLAIPPFALRKGQPYWLPKWVVEHPLVNVVPLPADYGPASKLFGALFVEEDPDTCIITLDDDASVPPHTVIKLVDAALVLPHAAIGFSGWNITCAASLPCWQWGGWNYHYIRSAHDDVCERSWKQQYGEHHCGLAVTCGAHAADVLMGVTGVLYRRWAFNESALDLLPQYYRDSLPKALQPQRAHWLDETARRLIALADDVWLSTWLSVVGVPRFVVPDARQAAQGGCPVLGLYYTQQQMATRARNFVPITLDIEQAANAVKGVTEEQALRQCTAGCTPVIWLDLASHEPVSGMSPQEIAAAKAAGKSNRKFPVSIAPPHGGAKHDMPSEVDAAHLIAQLWTRLQVELGATKAKSHGNKHITLDRIRHFPVDVMDSLHGHEHFDLYNKLVVFWAMAHGGWPGRWVPNDFYREPVSLPRVQSAFEAGYSAWEAAKTAATKPRRGGLGQVQLPADALLEAFNAQVVPGADDRGWHWMQANETLASFIFLQRDDSTNMQADMQKVAERPAPSWWPPERWDIPPPLLHKSGK